ncbi:MAG TPA: helix-turn-helix transcriptional regulator [Streptosporangiaceae bacterium]|nr:helix-turn-helix transcriptional regulator [Streptosporangiaceae bacterium]
MRPAPAPDETTSESLVQMRRALGRQLAALRNRAGLSQWDLAPLTGYSRSTLSDAELGRHRLRREFWVRCDGLLKAENRLVAGYDQIESAGAVLRQRARGVPAPHLQAVEPTPPEPPSPDPVAADQNSRVAVESCPHCRRPIAVLLVPSPR